jgi:hypothetical protein
MQREPTSPRVLAVNGQDPALYQRFEAIGHPLGPITHCRVSLGPGQRWVDFDHLPTEAELRALVDPARSERDDADIEARLEAEHFDPGDPGQEPEGWD